MAGLDPATQLASIASEESHSGAQTRAVLGGRLKGGHGENWIG